ncbi:hypothetical protein NE897_06670 [Yersinia ruckeri]|uniref:DUF6950 family protein n=1 Tax=Yersinia ruckeri TaxID=29486 RepID=UPI0004E337D4|nr:hypothetical protein [Yersinia ruckeri]ARZ01305.1 hypothetical protein QMA0440_01972 [Yersinia ruckeri]EKN4700350.1 hypothetical protein [Yersinia ruckeri]ELM3740219.1 hypothetical protein [Yersinia ruckeri]KFE37350.1 hypothetical protein nADLYRO1b_3309 [Yersinia ruckeri]MCW6545390.1 hypothetical protein [Yersinia ruckeri]
MRHPDWQQRLAQTLQVASERPFLWGQHDCCLFAADCAIAVCGVDPLADYRGQYDSALSARKVLLRGHGSLAAIFDSVFDRVPIKLAQRGDIVTFHGEQGITAGVLWNGCVWSTAQAGAAPTQVTIDIAWRVHG